MTDKCALILNWAQGNKSFDTTFVLSVLEFIDDHDYVTEAQQQALDNIIKNFHMCDDEDGEPEEDDDDFIVDDDEELSEYRD